MSGIVNQSDLPKYPREFITPVLKVFGRVRDYNALREAIDLAPNLFSARLSNDYTAIMIELNQYLPDGMLITTEDVKKAMDLRPVPQPTGIVRVTGRATGAGGA